METFLIIGAVLLTIFIGFNIWFFFARKEYRYVVEDPYVWLEVMSLSVWKTIVTLQEDLRNRRGLAQDWTEKIPDVLVYADLNQLAREGLIEQKPQLKEYAGHRVTILVYRLTLNGLRKFGERRNVSGDGETDSYIQPA